MMSQEEQLLEAFWSNEEQARKPLPRRDVSTSRRHQVTTWRSTKPEVNHSPRRDVPTSRRHHVATSPRRDVSSKICISSLNARGLGILGHRRTCGQRHEFGEPATLTLRIFLDFCIDFSYCFDYCWITLGYSSHCIFCFFPS